MASVVRLVHVSHAWHRASGNRHRECELCAVAADRYDLWRRLLSYAQLRVPYDSAVHALGYVEKFGMAACDGHSRKGCFRHVDKRDHVVVDIAADGGGARRIEHDRFGKLAFADLELKLLDRRERIDLMRRHVVVREGDGPPFAHHDNQRQERLVTLID